MATQTETGIEELKEKAERLWRFDNAINLASQNLHAHVNRAISNDNYYFIKTSVDNAEKELGEIRDAIQRYDNGLPQEYEEKAKD